MQDVDDQKLPCVSLEHRWAGREVSLLIIGGVAGFAVWVLIITSLKPTGAMGIISFLGCLFLGVVAGFGWRGKSFWNTLAIDCDQSLLVLGRSNGAIQAIHLQDVETLVFDAIDLATIIPGRSTALDLYVRGRTTRVYCSMTSDFEVRNLIGQAIQSAIMIPVECKALVPAPPELGRHEWFGTCESRIRRAMLRTFRQTFTVGSIALIASAGLLAAQVAMFMSEGEDSITGSLLLVIIVPGAICAINYWSCWRTTFRLREFRLQLIEARDHPDHFEIIENDRIELWVDESLPDHITGNGKLICCLSILFCCLPVIGFGLALAALRSTWERPSGWHSLAWASLIFSATSTFLGLFMLVMIVFDLE